MSNLPPTASPQEIRRALEENLWALWCRFGKGKGCTLVDTPSVLRFDTPLTQLPYNGVLRFRPETDQDAAIDAGIDEVFEHYRMRGVPFFWLVHPTTRPADLAARLEVRGLTLAESLPGMVASLASLPDPTDSPQGVRIRETTPDDKRQVVDLAAWRWGLSADVRPQFDDMSRAFDVGEPGSGLRCWIAERDGIAVSKAFIVQAAGVAGLYAVATRPDARGLGLARNLTLLGFQAARAEGYEVGVLHSSPMAFSLYEKMGFRTAETFAMYAPPTGFHV